MSEKSKENNVKNAANAANMPAGGRAPALSTGRAGELYSSPFQKGFWLSSAREFKNWRMMVFAALMIAMRVAIKSAKIPIVPGLSLSFDFIVNSAGSMIYGPLVALAVGAVSDTLGAIFFPTGPYFFPFIAVEMLSGFIFALFLYRQKLTTWRVVLSRLFVVIICNFIVNPAIMTVYYSVIMNKGYEFITIVRVIKNAAMFPLECIVLVFWLGAVSFATHRLGLTPAKPEKLKLNFLHIMTLILSLVIAVAAIFGYVYYKHNSDARKAAFEVLDVSHDAVAEVTKQKLDNNTVYLVKVTDGNEVYELHYDALAGELIEAAQVKNTLCEELGTTAKELKKFVLTFGYEGGALAWDAEFTLNDVKYEARQVADGKIELFRKVDD